MLVTPSIPMNIPIVEKAQDTFNKAKSAQEHATSQAADALAKIAPGIHLPPVYTTRVENVPAATLQHAQEVTPSPDDITSQNDNTSTSVIAQSSKAECEGSAVCPCRAAGQPAREATFSIPR